MRDGRDFVIIQRMPCGASRVVSLVRALDLVSAQQTLNASRRVYRQQRFELAPCTRSDRRRFAEQLAIEAAEHGGTAWQASSGTQDEPDTKGGGDGQ